MGAANSSEPANEVWPPDWEEMPENRRLARLLLSSPRPAARRVPRLAAQRTRSPREPWKFGDVGDILHLGFCFLKLNKIVYKLVPKKTDESDFGVTYFSEVLYVLCSVKTHGLCRRAAARAREAKESAQEKAAAAAR